MAITLNIYVHPLSVCMLLTTSMNWISMCLALLQNIQSAKYMKLLPFLLYRISPDTRKIPSRHWAQLPIPLGTCSQKLVPCCTLQDPWTLSSHSQPSCMLQPLPLLATTCIQSLFLATQLSCYMVSMYITIILTSTVLNHTSLTYKYLAMFACVRQQSYIHTTYMLSWIISKISFNIQTLGTKL